MAWRKAQTQTSRSAKKGRGAELPCVVAALMEQKPKVWAHLHPRACLWLQMGLVRGPGEDQVERQGHV